MRKLKFNIWIIIGAFIIMYNPPLIPFNAMHLVGIISAVYYIYKKTVNGRFVLEKRVSRLYLQFAPVFVYLLLSFIFLKDALFTNVLLPIYFLIDVIPFGLAVKIYGDSKGADTEDYIELLLIVGTVQAILSAIAYFVPAVQHFFVGRLLAYGYEEVFKDLMANRMFGFADGLTYASAALQALLGVLAVVYGINQGHKKKYYFLGGLMCLSGVINARTAIVVVLVGLFSFFFFSKIKLRKKIRMITLISIFLIVFILIIIPIMQEYANMNLEWITKGFEEIVTLLTGQGATGYFTYIVDGRRTVLPPTLFDTIFGLGVRTMGGNKYGVGSDIGYINDIWLGGIVYCILIYSLFGYFIWKMHKNKNRMVAFWGNMLLITFPLLNIKGYVCGMNDLSRIAVLTYLFFAFGGSLSKEHVNKQIIKEST